METIFYRENRIALLAAYQSPQLHRHFAKHILIAHEPFVCLIEDRQLVVRSMVIRSQVMHSVIKNDDASMAVMLIDEASGLSRAIDQVWLQGRANCSLPSELEQQAIGCLAGAEPLRKLDRCLIEPLLVQGDQLWQPDERILSACRRIAQSRCLDGGLYEQLAQEAFLSKSRFLHLFKREMGMDLKNYLLMKRMEKAFQLVIEQGRSITDAALSAGFASPSHFSQACRQHYGISLTHFLKAQKDILPDTK